MSNILNRLITEQLQKKNISTIVQIGANDGRINDPIYDVVSRFRERTRILLIEPQSELIPYLRENYLMHPSAVICNVAIGPSNKLTLYRVKPSLFDVFIRRHLKDSPAYRVPSGFTSAIKQHVYAHTRGNLPLSESLEEAIESIDVPCLELSPIINQLGWQAFELDFLQIDTEGMDDLVIRSCNIDLLKPALINFEHCHLSEPRALAIKLWLSKMGYSLYRWCSSDTLAVRDGYQSSIIKELQSH
jgi:FkbM family methyltransferase